MTKVIRVGVAAGVTYESDGGNPKVTMTIVGDRDSDLGAFCDELRRNSSIRIEYGTDPMLELVMTDEGLKEAKHLSE